MTYLKHLNRNCVSHKSLIRKVVSIMKTNVMFFMDKLIFFVPGSALPHSLTLSYKFDLMP